MDLGFVGIHFLNTNLDVKTPFLECFFWDTPQDATVEPPSSLLEKGKFMSKLQHRV